MRFNGVVILWVAMAGLTAISSLPNKGQAHRRVVGCG